MQLGITLRSKCSLPSSAFLRRRQKAERIQSAFLWYHQNPPGKRTFQSWDCCCSKGRSMFLKKCAGLSQLTRDFFCSTSRKSLHLGLYQSSCPQLFSFKNQCLTASFTVASYTAFSSVRRHLKFIPGSQDSRTHFQM